jgi:hypothetical protein
MIQRHFTGIANSEVGSGDAREMKKNDAEGYSPPDFDL